MPKSMRCHVSCPPPLCSTVEALFHKIINRIKKVHMVLQWPKVCRISSVSEAPFNDSMKNILRAYSEWWTRYTCYMPSVKRTRDDARCWSGRGVVLAALGRRRHEDAAGLVPTAQRPGHDVAGASSTVRFTYTTPFISVIW